MNAVSLAVRKVGGPTQASFICQCSAAAIYKWRKLGFVYDSRAAVRLSRASGIPIEQLAGLELVDGGNDGPARAKRPKRRKGGTPATYPALAVRGRRLDHLPPAAAAA